MNLDNEKEMNLNFLRSNNTIQQIYYLLFTFISRNFFNNTKRPSPYVLSWRNACKYYTGIIHS